LGIGPKYFERALDIAVKDELRNARWRVFEHYELTEEDGETFVAGSHTGLGGLRVVESDDEESSFYKGVLNTYAPLRTPELVVDLAELAEKEITPEDVVGWAEIYGLLGISSGSSSLSQRDSVLQFAQAAKEVWACLRAYETLTSEERVGSEKLCALARDWPVETHYDFELEELADQPRSLLFSVLGRTVQMRLLENCYPWMKSHTRSGFATGRFNLTWGFRNLLGAIWLHMAWLLETEGERVRRCKLPDCLRVIHFEPRHTLADPGLKKNARGKYKTRVDREFCEGRGCKQKYHYRKKAGWRGYY